MALTKKQKEVFDFIKDYIEKNDVSPTQKEIKDHFDLKSFGSVNKYMQYLVDANLIELDWNARRSIRILEVPSALNNLSKLTSNIQAKYDYQDIPLLGDVAAGDPIEALENYTETTTVPSSMIAKPGKYYALNICGDSMIEDGIHDGDIIICRHQNHANQGQTVVAVIDGEATVKKFYNKKSYIELHPANTRLSPFKVTQDQHFKLAGVVVGLLRSYE